MGLKIMVWKKTDEHTKEGHELKIPEDCTEVVITFEKEDS